MAFDLLSKKKNTRDWAMPDRIFPAGAPAAESREPAPTPTVVDEAIELAARNNPGLSVKQRGRGAVVTKKFLF